MNINVRKTDDGVILLEVGDWQGTVNLTIAVDRNDLARLMLAASEALATKAEVPA